MSGNGNNKHEQAQRKAEEEAKDANREYKGLVDEARAGRIVVVSSKDVPKDDTRTRIVVSVPPNATAPAATATAPPTAIVPPQATTPAPKPAATDPQKGPKTTVAGMKEYGDFFGLYNRFLQLLNEGENVAFRPLGFIPGPAVIFAFRDEDDKIKVAGATPDVARGLKVSDDWLEWDQLPDKVRQAAAEWKAVVTELGCEASSWSGGYAHRLLEGKFPRYLAMAMPRFRYQRGDKEKPFGVLLTATETGMKVEKIFNPGNISDVPAVGVIMTLDALQRQGPAQKLLRTWALMESNWYGRFGRNQQAPKPAAPAAAQPAPKPAAIQRPTFKW